MFISISKFQNEISTLTINKCMSQRAEIPFTKKTIDKTHIQLLNCSYQLLLPFSKMATQINKQTGAQSLYSCFTDMGHGCKAYRQLKNTILVTEE